MLIVHHLQVSQSDRVVFLCEELEIPYKLVIHKRDPIYSPQSIRDLHPVGSAPIIEDTDAGVVLAETSAIVRYIINKFGNGKLELPPDHKDYARYLYWFHFIHDTFMPSMLRMATMRAAGVPKDNRILQGLMGRADDQVKHIEDHLRTNTWLAGDDFTAADIMGVFGMTTGRSFSPYDLSPYPNILAYLKRLTARPAYVRAHNKADPDLPIMIGGPSPPPFRPAKAKL